MSVTLFKWLVMMRRMTIAFGICIFGSVAFCADSNTVKVCVVSDDPIGEAFLCLGERYGRVVNFEEPWYYNDEKRLRAIFPGQKLLRQNFFSVRERKFSIQFSLTNSIEQAIQVTIDASLRFDGVEFKVLTNSCCPGEFTILPNRWFTGSNVVSEGVSILDRRLSFSASAGAWVRSEVARLFADVQKTNPYDDSIDFMTMTSAKIAHSFVATNEPVYSILCKICCSDRSDVKNCWQLRRAIVLDGKRKAHFCLNNIYAKQDAGADRMVVCHTKRPLADALRIVSLDIGKPVGYEGPELKNGIGCIGVVNGKGYCPSGAYFKFSYLSTCRVEQIMDAMLPSIHLGYSSFGYVKSNDVICVVPKFIMSSLSLGGTNTDAHPISSARISVLADYNMVAVAVLESICGQLGRATGETVVLSPNAASLKAERIEYRADNLPGWFVLAQYLQALPRPLSWTLLYDPAKEQYVLDVYDYKLDTKVVGVGEGAACY